MPIFDHPRYTRFRARGLQALALVALCAGISSCALLNPPPAPTPPPAETEIEAPVVVPEISAEQREIERLLAEAEIALAEDRLMTPPEDCAYYRYVRVLFLDSTNAAARIGISDIVERYLNWALQEAQSRRFGRARAYLESAVSIDDTHPNISAVERQIDELQHARSNVYKLPLRALTNRNADAIALLRRIGLEIAAQNASVIITARTDEEGRWIYQQLNDMAGTRVRAELQLGTPPSIELLSLPKDSGS